MAPVASDRPDVDLMLAQFPGPVRLSAAKSLHKVILIGCLVLEFLLVKALVTGQGVPAAVLGVAVVVLAQILWCALVLLRRDTLALALDRDGFTIRYLLRPRTLAWDAVGDFTAWKSRAFDLTMYNDATAAKGTIEAALSRYRKSRFGRDAALPDTYHLGAERLAQLMSLWRQRALSGRR